MLTVLLLQYTLLFACILSLVAVGGMFCERSGIFSLHLEGLMCVGAMAGALMMRCLPNDVPALAIIIATLVVSLVVGMLYSSLLGIAAIHFNADQTLIGTAMNILGVAFSTVIVKSLNTISNPNDHSSLVTYINQKKAFIVNINGFEFYWIMLIALVILVVAYIILYKTRFGLRLMSCGEHPQAAASVGINVYKMRWAGILISGALGGIGGIAYIMAGVSEWHFEYGVNGFGFLALAVMIFGKWRPQNIIISALLFAFFKALADVSSQADTLSNLCIPSGIYKMLPYIISLIVLAFTSAKSRAPKAEGIPYDPSAR